ncbi:MAG: DUF4962 domain-containing protein [Lentisphaeria bacterium]|nr:DUF4962 domain-containing protein [Lentisphaeria bacterium]
MGAIRMQVSALVLAAAVSGAPAVDDSPAKPGEWGFRPEAGGVTLVTPPGFAWRPVAGAVSYDVSCSRQADFGAVGYAADGIEWNVHCPSRVFEPGVWYWRYRARSKDGEASSWSQVRKFTVAESATAMPLPDRAALAARIPDAHPRLFLRPEDLGELRRRAREDLQSLYTGLKAECDKLVERPPPTAEPPKYPADMERGSDPWRSIWWGNRTYTIAALNGAATLAFTRLLDGNRAYGELARRLLLECAQWDPRGATGYRYNDEAGMPYAYYFSRTYTFLHDFLSNEEREICRGVMAVRGEEMYRHLCPRHLWNPYASHSNRAWHFLGEVGIAFHGEIPEADQWAWFAANVFACVYPVWCDEDGGWHEGSSYWSSYISRFTWWADVMKAAMGIDAYDKPYFSSIGYYAMVLQPPGTQGGGFGDLCAKRTSASNRQLMSVLAGQAGNGHWQWYVLAHGEPQQTGGYVGFVRGALPPVEPRPPLDLPSSRCFQGTGQAMLNSNLLDAADNVQVIFKSSPFGTQSHGYESQNAFLLYAFGERLFIRTGYRDSYGSAHHREWMWQTKSVNSITVNGKGQQGHSQSAVGRIGSFVTTGEFDFVEGEGAAAYGGALRRFTRRILFAKPDVVLLHDLLEAPEPATFEWWLHAPVEMTVAGQGDIRVVNGKAACQAAFLWPEGLEISQTDRFDTPPRPRIKLVEYHLTARTPGKQEAVQFVTVLRPHPSAESLVGEARLQAVEGGFGVTVPVGSGGELCVLLRGSGERVSGLGMETDADVLALVRDAGGQPLRRFAATSGVLSR